MSATLALPSPKAKLPATPLRGSRGIAIAGILVIALFLGAFGAWSALAPLESAAMGPGVVEAESSRKTIQHLEGGIVGEILVKDGDEVDAGQVLLRLDETKASTTLAALSGQLWDARAREARLIAERDQRDAIAWPADLAASKDPQVQAILAGQDTIFRTRRTLLQSKIELIGQRSLQVKEEIVGLKAQQAAAKKRLWLIQQEAADLRVLVDKGLERRPRMLQLERDQAEIEGRNGDLIAQIARAQQTIAENEINAISLRNDRQNEVANDLRDTQKMIHELGERIQAARDVLQRIEVKAPEDGTVTDLKVHTPGGVVQAGEPLMDLVPRQDKLIVTAQLRPEDIDAVHPGLFARVRLIPYKQRRTPPVDATVIYVSADRMVDKKTGQAYYAAKLRLDETTLASLPEIELMPGMPAEVMIKTGERTAALYALSPVLDSFHRAFREK